MLTCTIEFNLDVESAILGSNSIFLVDLLTPQSHDAMPKAENY